MCEATACSAIFRELGCPHPFRRSKHFSSCVFTLLPRTEIFSRTTRNSPSRIRARSSEVFAGCQGFFDVAVRETASALNAVKWWAIMWSNKTATAPTHDRTAAARYCLASKHEMASSTNRWVSRFTTFTSCARSEEATFGTGEFSKGPASLATCSLPLAVSSHPPVVLTAFSAAEISKSEMFQFFAALSPFDTAMSRTTRTAFAVSGVTARQTSNLSTLLKDG